MPSRLRALLIGASAICVAFVAVSAVLPDATSTRGRRRVTEDRGAPPTSRGERQTAVLRSYALSLDDLRGLSPNAAPGTRLELWVTYEPPVTKRVRNQLLIRDAVLDRIVPALDPLGPDTALLLVRNKDIPKLITAERFGSPSASVRA